MKISLTLSTVFLFLAATTTARGDDFNKLDGSSIQHAESGWVFPERVGEFGRDGEPKVVGGARDGVVDCKDAAEGRATVYIYSLRYHWCRVSCLFGVPTQ